MGAIILIGIVTFFNLIILKIKFEKERYADLAMDVGSIVILNVLFGGTLTGMTIAMISSFLISLYLLVWPPKFI